MRGVVLNNSVEPKATRINAEEINLFYMPVILNFTLLHDRESLLY